jgi:hypothetical protein
MTADAEENLGTQPDFSLALASLDDFEGRSASEKNQILKRAQELADHLVDCFFLPCKLARTSILVRKPIANSSLQQ